MKESTPLPALAVTAIALHQAASRTAANRLAVDILSAMALNPADGWHVDFSTLTATRDAPTP